MYIIRFHEYIILLVVYLDIIYNLLLCFLKILYDLILYDVVHNPDATLNEDLITLKAELKAELRDELKKEIMLEIKKKLSELFI